MVRRAPAEHAIVLGKHESQLRHPAAKTGRLFNQVYRKFGIKFHYLPLQHPENLESLLSDRTKLVWLETPTNPMMNIIDIKAIVDCLQHKEVLVAVDNTFATPYLQNPLHCGAKIVVHSATKYIG